MSPQTQKLDFYKQNEEYSINPSIIIVLVPGNASYKKATYNFPFYCFLKSSGTRLLSAAEYPGSGY